MQDQKGCAAPVPPIPRSPFLPPKHLLEPLAVTLSQQVWTVADLTLHLRQRLPAPLSRLANPLAKSLIRAFPASTAPDAGPILRHLLRSTAAPRLSDHAARTQTRPEPALSEPRFHPPPSLAHLPPLPTSAELADFLAITPDQLTRFADLRGLSALSSDPFGPHYRCHLIPKRSGQLRLIEEPRPFLKTLQRRILSGILAQVPPHPAAMGFTKGRNCITGAARHAGEALVLSFDLADFFPRLHFPRIYAIFRTLGYPASVARTLAGLTTALTPGSVLQTPNLAAADALSPRHLPQGAPTSPALANLAALALDRRLSGLTRSLDATYTRYADDLTFSGDARIGPILAEAVPDIVAGEGFRLNPGKTRQARAHQRQTVTGLTVNAGVNLPRKTYDELKAILHALKNPTDPRRTDRAFLAHLSGRIAWAEQAAPQRGAKLRDRFDTLMR